MNKLVNAIKSSRAAMATLGVITVGGISAPTSLLIAERNNFNKTLNYKVKQEVNKQHGNLQKEKSELEQKQKESEQTINGLKAENSSLKNREQEWNNSKQELSTLRTANKTLTSENEEFKKKESRLKEVEQKIQEADKKISEAKYVQLKDELKGSLLSWSSDAINKNWSGYKPYFCLYYAGYQCWTYGALDTIDKIQELIQ